MSCLFVINTIKLPTFYKENERTIMSLEADDALDIACLPSTKTIANEANDYLKSQSH